MSSLTISLAQLNPLVGDLVGNAQLMREAASNARLAGADVIVLPELSLTGYPPEDLLLFPAFIEQCEQQLQALAAETDDSLLWLVGSVGRDALGNLTNEAVALGKGKVLARYAKQALPNYGVFDEQRYFSAGNEACVINWQGVKLGLLVCEDLWQAEPARLAQQAGAEVLVS
jgi:NAD+ synthase (glutamine-hydrolysing)